MLIDEVLKDFVEYRYVVLGLVIVLFAMLWPQGISGAIDSLKARLKAKIVKQTPSPVQASPKTANPGDS